MSQPIVYAAHHFGDISFHALQTYVTSKKELEAENLLLKRRVAELERSAPADRLASIVLNERDSLAESIADAATGIYANMTAHTAEVVSYVDYPFGSLGVHFTQPLTDTTPGQTRYVFDASGVCIGLLDSTLSTAGLVRLFSRAGEEHQMRIGDHEIALVRGKGGVTLEAVLPKNAQVTVGDPVALPEAGHALVGSVGEITSSDTDTTQLALIRLAVTPQDVRIIYVFE